MDIEVRDRMQRIALEFPCWAPPVKRTGRTLFHYRSCPDELGLASQTRGTSATDYSGSSRHTAAPLNSRVNFRPTCPMTSLHSLKIVFLIRCLNFGDKSTQWLKGLICRISISCLIGRIYHADTNVQQS